MLMNLETRCGGEKSHTKFTERIVVYSTPFSTAAKMLRLSFYLTTSLLITCCRGADTVTFEADPSPGSNEESSVVYIAADEGQQNVTVKCVVRLNGAVVPTSWRDVGEDKPIVFALEGGVSVSNGYGFLISSGISGNPELRIGTFTSDLDRFMLACSNGATEQQIVFFYGIPAITLLNSSIVYNITESKDFFLDLTNYNETSFPPVDVIMWTLDGVEIANGDSPFVMVTAYTITIRNITRNYTGRIFNVTVANLAGKRSEQFTLNVVYQPEVDQRDTQLYSSIGSSINITATSRIDGNPTPTITWVSPNDTVIIPGDNSRYHQSPNTPGVLSISDLRLSDFGVYRFIASNGVGNDQTLNISLILLVQPGQPRNLNYSLFSTSGVTMEWDPPTQVGVPPFTGYIVTVIVDNERDEVITQTYTTDKNHLELTDALSPGMRYNISVRAVSSFFADGGESSGKVSFKTATTGVRIGSIFGVSRDGHIQMQWALLTTGGHDINTIQVRIRCTTRTNTGGRAVSYQCSQNCFDTNLNGSQLVGPVDAGFKYVCTVTVEAAESFQTVTSSDIDSITGIPSAPAVVINNQVIHLSTRFIGTSSIADFKFNVEIKNETNMVVNRLTYEGMSERNVTVDTLAAGVYQVEVTSENNYGTSDITRVELTVENSATSSPTIGVSETSETDIALVAGVGGGGVGVVLLVILLVVLFISFVIHRKTKYNSTTFVSNGEIPEKKKFDRARIPSVGSTVLY